MKSYGIRFATIVLLSLAALPVTGVHGETQILHGADSSFRGESIGICWGIVKAPEAELLQVVMRIRVLDPARNRFGSFAVKGFDPFTGAEESIEARKTLDATNDILTPREDFKRLGGRRILFYTNEIGPEDQPPDLIVEYLGIPDTSPEFASFDALEKYFAVAFDRLRKP